MIQNCARLSPACNDCGAGLLVWFYIHWRWIMIWQYRHTFQALLIGTIILFPWCGIREMAHAESIDTQDTQQPGSTSAGKRAGQSPANKRTAKPASENTRQSGSTATGKRPGQSPASKRATKAAPRDAGENGIPLDDRRQGQSPGNE